MKLWLNSIFKKRIKHTTMLKYREYMHEYVHVDKVSNLDSHEFYTKYGFESKPVLIKDLMQGWNAASDWATAAFEKRIGNVEHVGTRVNDKKDKKLFKLSDYFQYMKECNDPYPYYLLDCKFHIGTDMMNDYAVPDYFRSCLDILGDKIPTRFKLSSIFIGATNTFSDLHLDIYNTSAWNGVITGRKFWLFYPPGNGQYLYNGLVNPFEPDHEKYPDFAKAKPIICIQHPGEVVFTPSGWWHAVFNEVGGISLTENFINETNFETVKTTLLFHDRIQELKIVEECMFEFAKINK